MVDRRELDAKKAHDFFGKLGIKLSLIMVYNLEANGKSNREIHQLSKYW